MLIKVSVVVPVYNVQNYLAECLDSIQNQTLTELEIICINDGSTDDSKSILYHYAKEDSRIKIIDKSNSGYGNSVNLGIDQAAGEYVTIVEPDDYIEPQMYEELYQAGKEYNADVVKANYDAFYGEKENRWFEPYKVLKDSSNYGKVLEGYMELSILNSGIANWAGIYQTSYLKGNHIRHNETPGASYQDIGFWFQIFTNKGRFFFIDKSFYRYRRDNPNSSVARKDKVYCVCKEYQFVTEYLRQDMEKYELYRAPYWYYLFYSYVFNMHRIAQQYKEEFVIHFSEQMKEAIASNELDLEYFNEYERTMVESLIGSEKIRHYFWVADKTEILSQIKGKKHIYIYGAGILGTALYERLHDMGIYVESFVVSELRCDSVQQNVIPVVAISQIELDKEDAIVLIAMRHKDCISVTKELLSKDVSNVIPVLGGVRECFSI